MEVETLRHELPIFKTNYPADAYQKWVDWLEKVDDLLTLPAEWVWPIDHLQTAARVRPGIADSAAALNNLP